MIEGLNGAAFDASREYQRILDEAKSFRHWLHAHPELTWQEVHTSEKIADELRRIPGMKVRTGVGRLGVVGHLQGGRAGPHLALRADMDALPVLEKNFEISYRSQVDGVMHACGHDGHSANLLAAAKYLASPECRDRIPGSVSFVFQPAEEGGAGAKAMVDDGVLEGVDAIFGLHGWPELPLGQIYVREGAMLAGNAELRVSLSGKGGHAAMPHLCSDQILAAADMIQRLQSISSRIMAPTDDFVLSITIIEGGHAKNVIPDEVRFSGTVRYLDPLVLAKAKDAIAAITSQLGPHQKATFTLEPGYPPVINHGGASAYLAACSRTVLGDDAVKTMPKPSMGSEDFAYYLQKVPGAFFLVGMDDGRAGGYPSLHHPCYDFNDAGLDVALKVYLSLVLSADLWSPKFAARG